MENKKVVVAMSGGVDSAVAAALLKKEGFDLVGVFIKFWAEKDKSGCVKNRCCTPESERRARLIAEKLKIPFYVLSFEKEFKKKVVDYFLKNSKIGLTPNPCVICNKEIKFGLLFKKAMSLDADYIATGHYARLKKGKLLKAKDKNKDQSYFLWKLDQKVLKKTLFPVGDYLKPEIRELAKKFKLLVSDIPESQEICFIQTSISNFLLKYLKLKPGQIVDSKAKVLGRHQGLALYTIGQRKGIGLAGGPYYVLDKDVKRNSLIVTKNEKDLYKKELSFRKASWVSGKEPKLPLKVMVKIRYRHKPGSAILKKNKIIFSKPQRAVTPGQSVVFYQGQELIGGAIIQK
jgi:tRNA-specific 2-thiouridylase